MQGAAHHCYPGEYHGRIRSGPVGATNTREALPSAMRALPQDIRPIPNRGRSRDQGVTTLRNPRHANGHRRRQAVARIRARDTHCALCGQPIDPSLPYVMPGQHGRNCSNPQCQGCLPHPMRGEVDENIPVSRGGSPTDLDNLTLLHRTCNRFKSTMTLNEAKAMLAKGARVSRPLNKAQRQALSNPRIGSWARDAGNY